MRKNRIFTAALAAMLAAPALAAAQEGPDGDVPDLLDGPAQADMQGRGDNGRMKQGRNHKAMLGLEPGDGPAMGGPVLLGEDETLALIKKTDAGFAKKLDDLKSVAPAKYKNIVQMSSRALSIARMDQDDVMQKNVVRGLSLEFEVKELGLKYDKASEAERKAIKETLRARLSELFDLKTGGQEQRLARMQKEIARLRKNMEKRKANKSKIVEQRLDQVTGEGFGW